MKNIIFIYVIIILSICMECFAMPGQRTELEDKLLALFELDSKVQLGTSRADSALLQRLAKQKTKDRVLGYVLRRAQSVDIGVTIFAYKSLFFSWRDVDRERRILDVEIQVGFDENMRPVNVISSIKRGAVVPLPECIPAEKSEITIPPERNSPKEKNSSKGYDPGG